MSTSFDLDPSVYFRAGEWGQSLANVAEILLPCLEAAEVDSVLEIGASTGDTTRPLLEWARGAGARVTAIEPLVGPELEQLARDHPELRLVRGTSLEALVEIEPADAVIVDGDHNYYTVSEELRLISERAPEGRLPLLLFHDVAWPHARRDTYYDPERIPERQRQPLAENQALNPGEPGVDAYGLPFVWAAEREGGPRNGVLTAIEDFARADERLRLAIVPAFFGLGVLWHVDRSWSDALAAVLAPWDRNPMLARLEASRIVHLVAYQSAMQRIEWTSRLGEDREHLLRAMLGSRAFAIAERLSSIGQRGKPVFSRDQIRRALGDQAPEQ
jgi:hypothetical protein